MKKYLLLLFSFSIFLSSFAQNSPDSSKDLNEVVVRAYEQNKQLQQTSAAVNYVSPSELARYNNTNILPAMNSTPGVRMEERSPASYRLNIRGSTLRSPFGVRNVKVYWDDLPLTDAGGNTYLNQLSYYNFNSIEVIKGPGGSLYGAGTGGVVLIHSQPATWNRGFDASLLGGSYGLLNTDIQLRVGKDDFQNTLTYSHQNSAGFRQHTSMYREVANWQMKIIKSKKEEIKFTVLYGDLYYQTPGALTKTEFLANARAERPKAGAFQSADSIKASILQKTVIAGITNHYQFTGRLDNTTTVYGDYTDLTNPTFRNYERRKEPQWGVRTVFRWNHAYTHSNLQLVAGSEFQQGYFNTRDYVNNYGKAGDIMTNDNVHPTDFSAFAQANLELPKSWDITLGASTNISAIYIDRISVANFVPVNRVFNNEIAPRVALSKKLFGNFWLYGSVSKGFSPPAVAEVLPSTTVISTDLQAEHGIDYEAGFKSSWLNHRLYIEVNAFYYRLQNAIVSRKDSSNADFFTNAGSTKQRGIESQASYKFFEHPTATISSVGLWISHTFDKFNYDNFKQSTTDFSGNQLPSIPKHTAVAGFDIVLKGGLYSNLTYSYTDRIPLNDANSDFASSYNLLSERLGWRKQLNKKALLDVFVGGDNLFNVTYSLGNDINAAGGRYYNVAPGRNFFAGASIHFN